MAGLAAGAGHPAPAGGGRRLAPSGVTLGAGPSRPPTPPRPDLLLVHPAGPGTGRASSALSPGSGCAVRGRGGRSGGGGGGERRTGGGSAGRRPSSSGLPGGERDGGG